jgi:hypothetical protein
MSEDQAILAVLSRIERKLADIELRLVNVEQDVKRIKREIRS